MSEEVLETTTGNTLYAKMSRVMGVMERIPKNGFNQHFKYAFVTDADVIDTVRAAMTDEGLAFFASMDSVHQEEKQGKRDTFTRTIVNVKLTFADGESGETMSVNWIGEANDSQDKGVAKAATSAIKYALLKTFLISTGDEPDADSDGPVEGDRIEEKPTPKKPVPKKIKPNDEKGPIAVKVWLLKQAQDRIDGGRIGTPNADDVKKLAPTLNNVFGSDEARKVWIKWLAGVDSIKKISGALADVLWTNLKANYDTEAKQWTATNEKFVVALKLMYQQALKDGISANVQEMRESTEELGDM